MIEPDKRKAIFLLHQEGMPSREIARRLGIGRNTVHRVIALAGQMPATPVATPPIDAELLRRLHQECDGYVQRVHEKLVEELGYSIRYSTLTRWLRKLGINVPPEATRCERVPDEPGAEMQHDTSSYVIPLNGVPTRLVASLLYLRYSKRRYLQFYRCFDRLRMKFFLHRALVHWGHAPRLCVIDNTNLARWRGVGSRALLIPEMVAFAKTYGFTFLCHAPKHSDRKAGEERSFSTVESNFLPGRSFGSLEDLNLQALEWSTVRLEQRPQGKAGLIPAQAFEHERLFLQELPPHLPAPYALLDRSIDEYGYVAVDTNYYEVPGSGRGNVQVLRYENHIRILQSGQCLFEHTLFPDGTRNKTCPLPEGSHPRHPPRHLKRDSDEEEKRLRALDPAVGEYVDFLLKTQGLQRHRCLRQLLAISQRMSPELFVTSVRRAHRYRVECLQTLEKISRMLLGQSASPIPSPSLDDSFRDRPAYQEGSITDSPDLSHYE